MQFHGMNPDDARAFAEKWLPAWTGNRPELLASFNTLDAVYSDPAIPDGVPLLHPHRRGLHRLDPPLLRLYRRHPRDLEADAINRFLTDLAVREKVAASTLRQALSAILFLYREVLKIDPPRIDDIVRAKDIGVEHLENASHL